MIKEKEKLVRKLLIEVPSTRDHDNKLVSAYWHEELKRMGVAIHIRSTRDLLAHIWEGRLSSGESITRCRRKVQELTPELRGTKWKKRHDELQEVVITDIREMEDVNK